MIGAYRNERGLYSNVVGGVVSGALAGYLFRDLKILQIEKTFKHGRFVGGSLSVVGGAAAGCLIGGVTGVVHLLHNGTGKVGRSQRYYEQYWNAIQQQVKTH